MISKIKESWIDYNEYPFKSNYFELTSNHKIHYIDEGQGQPMLMIHGNPTWSFLYRKIIKIFSQKMRCIAPDNVGFGLSDKPKDFSYFPEDHSKNLLELIQELDLKNIILVVHDWGGPIGLSVATQYPDLIDQIIIMNTWAWPVNDDLYYRGFSFFMGTTLGKFLNKYFNFFTHIIMRQSFGDKSLLTKEIHNHYLTPTKSKENRIGTYVFPRRIIKSRKYLKKINDNLSLLSEKPILILWGMKDIAFREKELNRWRSIFPYAEVHKFEKVGHYVQEEDQDLSQRILTFIQ